ARRPASRGAAFRVPAARLLPRPGGGLSPPADRRDPGPLRRQPDARRGGPEAPAHLPRPPHPPARYLVRYPRCICSDTTPIPGSSFVVRMNSGNSPNHPASKGGIEEDPMNKTMIATLMSLIVAGSVF